MALRAFAGPMPGRSCSTRNAATVLRGLSAQRSTAIRSLMCAASRNFRPPYFTYGILRFAQLHFEHVTVARAAEQNGLALERHVRLAALQYFRADAFGLRLQVRDLT